MKDKNRSMIELLSEFFGLFGEEFEKLNEEYEEFISSLEENKNSDKEEDNKEEYLKPTCEEVSIPKSTYEFAYISSETNPEICNKEVIEKLDECIFKIRTHKLPINVKITFDYKALNEAITFIWNEENDRFENTEYNAFYSELSKEFFPIEDVEAATTPVNCEKEGIDEKADKEILVKENNKEEEKALEEDTYQENCPDEYCEEKNDEYDGTNDSSEQKEPAEESFVIEPNEPVTIPNINDYLGNKQSITASSLLNKINNWKNNRYTNIKIPLLLGLDKVFMNDEYSGYNDNEEGEIKTLVVRFVDIIAYTQREIDLDTVLDVFNEKDFSDAVKERYGFTKVEFDGNTVKTLKMYCTLE